MRAAWCVGVATLFVGLGMIAAARPAPAGEPKVDVKSMTYAKLADFLAQQRGKVVLVDLWNLGCPPCIQAMPHLAELHEKYASKGLVVVSLNLDDPSDPEAVDDVKGVLMRKKLGAIHNIMLAEKKDFWPAKFDISGVPCVFIFDRAGKWHKYYEATLQVQDATRRVKTEMLDEVVRHLLAQPEPKAK